VILVRRRQHVPDSLARSAVSLEAMIVLHESSAGLNPTAALEDLEAQAAVARQCGARIYAIPPPFVDDVSMDDALRPLWPTRPPEIAIWLGSIPSHERYHAVYEALRRRGALLCNSPDAFARAMYLDRACARLGDLTPRTAIVAHGGDLHAAVTSIGLPVFVRSSTRSLKADGWSSCVAHSVDVAAQIADRLRSGGDTTILVRQVLSLRHAEISGIGVPVSREFRAFVLRGAVIALGFYWPGGSTLSALDDHERAAVVRVAETAAERLETPYVAVDVAQAENGRWWVIDVADAQFAGTWCVSRYGLWNELVRRCASRGRGGHGWLAHLDAGRRAGLLRPTSFFEDAYAQFREIADDPRAHEQHILQKELLSRLASHLPRSSSRAWDWLVAALDDPEKKWFAAWVASRARPLPPRFLPALVRAAVLERDPSRNRCFVEPAVAAFGAGRVTHALLDVVERATNYERAGAANALYWVRWGEGAVDPAEGAALGRRKREVLLTAFLTNDDIDVQRSTIAKIFALGVEGYPDLAPLFERVLAAAGAHPDDYVRNRAEIVTGRAKSYKPLPERREADARSKER
jgi:hypothetical protein